MGLIKYLGALGFAPRGEPRLSNEQIAAQHEKMARHEISHRAQLGMSKRARPKHPERMVSVTMPAEKWMILHNALGDARPFYIALTHDGFGGVIQYDALNEFTRRVGKALDDDERNDNWGLAP